ncbi:uncharacterized protein EV422DRAFT_512606 [Fimicolochytrium jonesii]|uniref:uncharacterized protein n=1 Tax=Fimicolochytrium jonesii TaxID=1396493 RepID=UPI0022FE5CC9|nr:uncharacterized protein EV422DRAFT_512606 [Fimicolochytrium jonesii]KAI8827092.1 hypothetical protein EV422DRAFT_512606 [Fimicolochytrium jonesii]
MDPTSPTSPTSPTVEDPEAGTGGADFNPADLAKEAAKQKDMKWYQKIRLPLWLVQSAIIIMILTVVIVPSSTIFITNAYSNSEDSAGVMAMLTLKAAKEGLVTTTNNYRQLGLNFGLKTTTTSVVSTAAQPRNLTLTPLVGSDFLKDFIRLSFDNPDVATITCLVNTGAPGSTPGFGNAIFAVSKWSLASEMPINDGPFGTLADLQSLLPLGAYWTFNHMERTDRNVYYKNSVDQNGVKLSAQAVNILMEGYTQDFWDKTKNITNFLKAARVSELLNNIWTYTGDPIYNASADPFYMDLVSSTPRAQGKTKWNYSNVYGAILAMSAVNIYGSSPTPTHQCQVGGLMFISLEPYIQRLLPSKNSFIFIFDAKGTPPFKAGTLIASSIPNAAVSQNRMLAPTSVYAIDETWHPGIAEVGKYLKAKGLFNVVGPEVMKARLDDGQDWYIAAEQISIDDAGSKWTVVIAFPRSDFFAAIDKSIIKSIIVIVCLSFTALVFTLATSVAFTVPLKALGLYMGEVTQMKFRFLEDGTIDSRSLIREIASLETAFAIMVRAFAAGIRKNACTFHLCFELDSPGSQSRSFNLSLQLSLAPKPSGPVCPRPKAQPGTNPGGTWARWLRIGMLDDGGRDGASREYKLLWACAYRSGSTIYDPIH